MIKDKKFLMYWRRFGRHERLIIPDMMVDVCIKNPTRKTVKREPVLRKFNPAVHIPATQADRARMEQALWEGWELTVDEATREIWIGNREEKVAACIRR